MFKMSARTSRKPHALWIIVFQGGDDGRGYRNMYKIPQGRTWIMFTGLCEFMYNMYNSMARLCAMVFELVLRDKTYLYRYRKKHLTLPKLRNYKIWLFLCYNALSFFRLQRDNAVLGSVSGGEIVELDLGFQSLWLPVSISIAELSLDQCLQLFYYALTVFRPAVGL